MASLSESLLSPRAGDLEWEAVQAALPPGGALLSLRAFNPLDFNSGEFSSAHWLALLMPAEPDDGPELVVRDLGPVGHGASLATEFRIGGSEVAAQAVYQRLFGELDAQLAEYSSLFIATDGVLDLLPLERLRLPDGRYWTQRQLIRRVAAGRNLLASANTPDRHGMLVLGGVDFARFTAPELEGETQAEASKAQPQQLALNRSLRALNGDFTALPHSANEAEAIGQYYWDHDDRTATVHLGSRASESLLKQMQTAPRVMHLATHGFFLPDNANAQRPLTLAGIALAGANRGMQGELSPAGEDGILYALEVQDLNLDGTELVTLSACDTGRGEVDVSEGVYGLVRAFRIAGAKNVLMTLWPVRDGLTRDFMKDFYSKWFSNPQPHPAEALREVQLEWINSNDERRDPANWAPYVLIEAR